ncbi:MAG: phospho-N-acetylmuramoyl-pentapeptide-transferase [Dehalococcoidia bacterium]
MTYALLLGCLAALVSLIAGNWAVALLRAQGIGKAISSEGPESHTVKQGTPTMGGLFITGTVLAVAVAAIVPRDADIWLPVAVAAFIVVIGFYDDLGTLVDRAQREAHTRTGMILKLAGFSAVGLVAGWILYGPLDTPRLLVPHYGHYDIGPIYILIAAGIIIATTSAVGVTDGLDMLAGSTSAVAFGAYGAIALVQDQHELAAFCFVVAGALLGFLWYNAYPARVFMGESGSLPLGAMLAIVALMTGWWLLLPLIGVVFVAEILSDVIQIGYFRLTGGKRVFRMAPLHHHFEKLGFHETHVTMPFLLVGLAGALLGVALAVLD